VTVVVVSPFIGEAVLMLHKDEGVLAALTAASAMADVVKVVVVLGTGTTHWQWQCSVSICALAASASALEGGVPAVDARVVRLIINTVPLPMAISKLSTVLPALLAVVPLPVASSAGSCTVLLLLSYVADKAGGGADSIIMPEADVTAGVTVAVLGADIDRVVLNRMGLSGCLAG
jgi:hypothetical protein